MSEPMAFPCPFCGSPATVIDDRSAEDWAPWIVRCVRCGNRQDGVVETYGDSREEAVERWNRRASPLTAAPPEDGRPTWEEVRDALMQIRNNVSPTTMAAHYADVLLSRIPKEEP